MSQQLGGGDGGVQQGGVGAVQQGGVGAVQQGDLQVNLAPKTDRKRNSHEIALDVRHRLKDLDAPQGSVVKVVEVPPGPPVIATLLAEIYGDDPELRRSVAGKVRDIFRQVPFIVDDDVSNRDRAPRQRFTIDQDNLEFHKVEERDVYDTIKAYLTGIAVGYSHKGDGRHPVEIAVQMPKSDLTIGQPVLTTPVPANARSIRFGIMGTRVSGTSLNAIFSSFSYINVFLER